MVALNLNDLAHILSQIQVAEEHNRRIYDLGLDPETAFNGDPDLGLAPLVSSPLLPYGLRTVDGSFNNFTPGRVHFGSADQTMPRLLDPVFPDAENGTSYEQTSGTVIDGQVRLVSNLVVDQTLANPAAIYAALQLNGMTGAELLGATGEIHSAYRALTEAQAEAARTEALATAATEAATTSLATAIAAREAYDLAAADPATDPAVLSDLLQAAESAEATAGLDADAATAAVNDATNAASLVDPAQQALDGAIGTHGIVMDGPNVAILNVSADLGDTAPYNGFFTIFGQFFDHGLDLTTKGGSGRVLIPLSPDDPLYNPASPQTNFMILTRATNLPGADGVLGTADDIRDHANETTPWVDLNQVYTSNPSHQVFLREYVMVNDRPVATGRMLEGSAGGPPTWADIKAQAAEMLGVTLNDGDIFNVPLLLTDLYGAFIPDANGFPQVAVLDGGTPGFISGTPGQPVATGDHSVISAGRAFLNDIAHSAVPTGFVDHDRNPFTPMIEVLPDDDDVAGNEILPNQFGINLTYDDELLDAHFIVGDGRGNENIALTAVHTIFHGEHNRQIDAIKATLLGSGNLAIINEWLAVPVTELPADLDDLVWNGERLFQASRFSTEMVYQHLVFEQFARAIAPQIDAFLFSNTVELDPAITEEFAQVVYRFGHSMLNEYVDILGFDNGTPEFTQVGLIEAFLNPIMFDGASSGDAHADAGAILRGMSRQQGNEIDEFMTEALRNNLVGLPLDLAALNMARARETGVPSLNEARRQIFEQTQDTYLKPYESWTEFAANIKNPLSIVNFIAAYGTHDSITGTADERRDAAIALVFGGPGAPEDRLDYLNSRGAWAGVETGLNLVDFWIGGLAEAKMAFGGMLGSTFTFVFENQMERLQEADRFYYLSRTQGMNLLAQLEGDSFGDLIRRNTDTEHLGVHVNANAFQTADYVIEMDQSLQWNPGLGMADPESENLILGSLLGSTSLVERGPNYLRFLGGEHVVLGGTNNSETIIGGDGDDAIWGDGGHDSLEGGYGVDHIFGGTGNDIITDRGSDIGEFDVIHGDAGDDVINPGMGLDLVFGGLGQDFIAGGSEDKNVFGGEGTDFIRGGGGFNFLQGNEGDDWMEGGDSFNTLAGESSELFFNSRIIGHDVLLAGSNDTDFDAESGDDIMVQSQGIQRNNGMAGFDWVTYQGNTYGADADMNVQIFVNQENNILRDRYDLVEGLSGWNYDDRLVGREVARGAYDGQGNAAQPAPNAPIESFSNVLLEKNLSLIAGLEELTAHLERFDVTHPNGTTTEVLRGVMDTSDGSDILLGGGGSDTIEGRAGNDIIDGDQFLQVRIGITVPDGPNEGSYSAFHMTDVVRDAVGAIQFGGQTLAELMFARILTPGHLSIIREIVDGGATDDQDTAVFWDVRENYDITYNDDGSVTVTHVDQTAGAIDPVTGRNRESDGVDRLTNIERLRFADQTVLVSAPVDPEPVPQPATGAPTIDDTTPTATIALTASSADIADPDGIATIALRWQASSDGGVSWTDIPGATGTTFTPTNAQATQVLRVVATVTDVTGDVTELVSTASGPVGRDVADTAGSSNINVGQPNGPTAFDDIINGLAGADTINAGDGSDTVYGGAGGDVIDAGAGNDTIVTMVAEGRDRVTGGDGIDTFILNGNNSAERFYVMTRAAWDAVLGNDIANLAATTEIVVLRATGADTDLFGLRPSRMIVAELSGIEEIIINTGPGNDTVTTQGNFTGTSLAYNTIHIDGSNGNDTVNIAELNSDHRISFRSGGGNDLILGNLRAQDQIVIPAGFDPAGYVATRDPETGLVTMTNGAHSVSFTGTLDQLPELLVENEEIGLTAGRIVVGDAGHNQLAGIDLAEDLRGRAGNDTIDAGAGDDTMRGGEGNDWLSGGLGDDHAYGHAGRDRMTGDLGNDDLRGGAGFDTLDYSAMTQDLTIDLAGQVASGIEIGVDSIMGFEVILAGSGNDTIEADDRVTVLFGGEGENTFDFDSATAAQGDTIADFRPGDLIDLSDIDADTTTAGNQSFTLVAAGGSVVAGSLVVSEEARQDGIYTVLTGHVNGDGVADFQIGLRGRPGIGAGDLDL